jgi:Domain of unknown function (DUF222)/HNH endonuclease
MIAWAARVDAEIEFEHGDGPNPDTEEPEQRSELFVSEIGDGQVVLNGLLDAEMGETVRTALDLARQLVNGEDPSETPVDSETVEDTDPGPASEGRTKEGGPVDDRSSAEQRAQALHLMARFFLDHNDNIETSAGNRPHVQVEINLNVVAQRIGGIGRTRHSACGLSAEAVRRILCDANITRIVTTGASEVLDVGRKTRAVPVALAKAIRHRDRHCRFPGCNVTERFTEIHHRIHWAHGGPTDQINCFLLCWRHHRMLHGNHRWKCQGNANHTLTFTNRNGDNYATAPPGVLC